MKAVTLLDGTVVAADSEAWRHECEARAIMALPGTAQRREWLQAIEHRRGKAVADALRATIMLMWRAKP